MHVHAKFFMIYPSNSLHSIINTKVKNHPTSVIYISFRIIIVTTVIHLLHLPYSNCINSFDIPPSSGSIHSDKEHIYMLRPVRSNVHCIVVTTDNSKLKSEALGCRSLA